MFSTIIFNNMGCCLNTSVICVLVLYPCVPGSVQLFDFIDVISSPDTNLDLKRVSSRTNSWTYSVGHRELTDTDEH